MDILPSACPLLSFAPSLKSFGESCASCTSLVPTGLPEGSSLGGVAATGGALATGGVALAGGVLATGGVALAGGAAATGGAAPPAGRAGSGDLPAHAHASKTTNAVPRPLHRFVLR